MKIGWNETYCRDEISALRRMAFSTHTVVNTWKKKNWLSQENRSTSYMNKSSPIMWITHWNTANKMGFQHENDTQFFRNRRLHIENGISLLVIRNLIVRGCKYQALALFGATVSSWKSERQSTFILFSEASKIASFSRVNRVFWVNRVNR